MKNRPPPAGAPYLEFEVVLELLLEVAVAANDVGREGRAELADVGVLRAGRAAVVPVEEVAVGRAAALGGPIDVGPGAGAVVVGLPLDVEGSRGDSASTAA